MGKMRIELNSAGVRELLQSSAMAAVCMQQALAIAGRAGPGYSVSTFTGATRVNASVRTETAEAMKDNMKNNTLLKAVR